MSDLICPFCKQGSLSPVGDTAFTQRISFITYEGRITRLRCTKRPGCGKITRFPGEISFQTLIADYIARNVKVCSADELRMIAQAAYILSGSDATAIEWLCSHHISPEIFRYGDAGEGVQQHLKNLLLERIEYYAKRSISVAPFARLTAHRESVLRLQRRFIYTRATAA